ncbi:MAG: carboxypeptidase regulatory-like domain-containing protein [Barnesiella sp.]|nr:carboxypeptidase regulatory-like domain-containing protein [Barnesiella sp.]MBD5254332.1 carboxypeptidase regulatory-like domain-containing protein [Barnesiella sp.]MBD5343605.1 carboxypeptidase regulatory-like domain-containing protein [Bacteroides sp.]MDE5829010.1 hypothetical protein [Duncaniella sp.]
MQLLSEESFSIIEPLLTDDYKRVRSRLSLLLNQADCEIFSAVDVLPNRGKWLSDSPVALSRYQAASPVEKEMIAAYIENAKARLLPAIAGHITGAPYLFRVPDENNIFWYRSDNGEVRVVLAQWGFKRTTDPGDVDVIEFLLAQPRPLSTADVTVEVAYDYGAPLADTPMQLVIFNNVTKFLTDQAGRYHVGKVKTGINFEVRDNEGGLLGAFTAETGRELYRIELVKTVDCTIAVVDRNSQPVAGYELNVNGHQFTTDDTGKVSVTGLSYKSADRVKVTSDKGDDAEYMLSPDSPNEFVYTANLPEEIKPEPEPRKVRVRILDEDGLPLDGVEVFVDQPGGVTLSAISDADGVALFPRDTFVDRKKSNVRFVLTAEYQKARAERRKGRKNR